MTAMHPLFDFMPYGAPELIATQRSSQLRALAIACVAAIVFFALAGVLIPVIPQPKPEAESVIIESWGSQAMPEAPKPHPSAPRPTPRAETHQAPDLNSIPVTMPDVPELTFAQDGGGTTHGVGGPPASGNGAEGQTAGVVEEAPPVWGGPQPEVMPQAILIIKPKYPDLPRDLGIEGRVYVRMLVGKDGRVIRAEIDPKYSIPMLDASALEAARQWVFTPAKSGGHAVPVWVGEVFDFRIRDQ